MKFKVSTRKWSRSAEGEHTANLVLLVVAVLDTSHEDGGLVREDEALAVLAKVTVTSVQDSVQHALVEKEVSHPLGNDDIDLGERQLNLLHLALQKGDLVGQAVHLDDLLGLVDDGGHVDTDNVLRASLGGEHAEDGGTAANVEDDLVLEDVGVVVDSIAVALGANLVFLWSIVRCVPERELDTATNQHLLVNTMVVVAVEVVTVRSRVSVCSCKDPSTISRLAGTYTSL